MKANYTSERTLQIRRRVLGDDRRVRSVSARACSAHPQDHEWRAQLNTKKEDSEKRLWHRKQEELKFELADGGEMSEEQVDAVVSILAEWALRDIERKHVEPTVISTHAELEEARKKLKSIQSVIDMMKGNTDQETLKKLQREWIDPIVRQIRSYEEQPKAETGDRKRAAGYDPE